MQAGRRAGGVELATGVVGGRSGSRHPTDDQVRLDAGLRRPRGTRSDSGRRGERAVSNEHEFWITGVGAVTPLGSEFECIAENLLAGRSGIGKLTSFDASEHPSQIAAELSEIPCPPSQ